MILALARVQRYNRSMKSAVCSISRRSFLALQLLGLWFVGDAAADSRTNFVICIADDVSWNDLGCYGSASARTPRIDALASKGRRFTEAYLTASSCSPSRSSIITSRYPHNLGRASELHQPIAAHLPWLPAILKQRGYYTAIVGKNHMTRENTSVASETWDRIDPGKTPGNDGAESKWAAAIQDRPKDQPFFFWFAAVDAHRDWDADQQWLESKYGPKHRPSEMVLPPFLVNDAATRNDFASYHNEITRFDYYVGEVVDALTSEGVIDQTLILVLADNGRPFPRAKTRLHDSGMKTPLIAHWPAGIVKPGIASASLVSSIDIAPTILEIAAIAPPPSFQGASFQSILNDPDAVSRRCAFSEHNWHDYAAHARAIRSEGWVYLRNARPELAWQGPADSVRSLAHKSLQAARNAKQLTPAQADVFLAPRPSEELYYTPDDPDQLRSLSDDPRHAATKAKLATLLDRWIDETGDTVPDPLAPDAFDRETGKGLGESRKQLPREDFPGKQKHAASVNAPGPG
jgi:N-sulfoglucosamine sulfohydrolase